MRIVEQPGLEPASARDAAEIAELYLAANADALPFVQRVHTDDEVRRWVRQVMLTRGETWVARMDGRIVGFLTLTGSDLDQLFLLPGYYRRGIGSMLLDHAKERSPGRLRLYTFRRNLRARAFYESHGFRVAASTDTQDDQEMVYEWIQARVARRATSR